MKLPRLQYTYAVFYSYYYKDVPVVSFGFSSISRAERIADITQLEGLNVHIDSLQKEPVVGLIITNYKLLSVKIILR